jgi:hypothetical protein
MPRLRVFRDAVVSVRMDDGLRYRCMCVYVYVYVYGMYGVICMHMPYINTSSGTYDAVVSVRMDDGLRYSVCV